MTSTRCEIFNWCLIPLSIIVFLFSFNFESAILNSILTQQAEVYALYFMAILVTLSHIHYGICMVSNSKLSNCFLLLPANFRYFIEFDIFYSNKLTVFNIKIAKVQLLTTFNNFFYRTFMHFY